jgi:hypothetical protein
MGVRTQQPWDFELFGGLHRKLHRVPVLSVLAAAPRLVVRQSLAESIMGGQTKLDGRSTFADGQQHWHVHALLPFADKAPTTARAVGLAHSSHLVCGWLSIPPHLCGLTSLPHCLLAASTSARRQPAANGSRLASAAAHHIMPALRSSCRSSRYAQPAAQSAHAAESARLPPRQGTCHPAAAIGGDSRACLTVRVLDCMGDVRVLDCGRA